MSAEEIPLALMNKKRKRMCYYNKMWELKYSWVSACDFDRSRARCSMCMTHFAVGYDGAQAVSRHATTKKHQKAVAVFQGPSSFTIKEEIDEQSIKEQKSIFNDKVSIAELVHFYHGVKHNISYHTQDCALKVFKHIISDSEIVRKMTGGRTKNSAIVNQVLYPFSMHIVLNDLLNGIPFSITIDTSNKRNKKVYPLAIQYFTPSNGICTKVLDFFENTFEDPQSVKDQISQILTKNRLSWDSVTSYVIDHSSLNFNVNNLVYQKVLEEENKLIIPTHCYVHILHACARNALKLLSFDVENLIIKIFGEFSDSNDKNEDLKELLDYYEKDLKDTLRELPNRWLNLFKALDKIVKHWINLKKYILCLGPCNVHSYIWNILADQEHEISDENKPTYMELYLYFVHHFMSTFQDILSQLERKSTTALDLHEILSKCRASLNKNISDGYFGSKVHFALTKGYLPEDLVQNFQYEASEVYSRAILYLEEWYQFDNLNYKIFNCLDIETKGYPTLDEIMMIWTQSPWKDEVPPEQLYDEYIRFEQILPSLVGHAVEKWCRFFTVENAPNLLKIIQFVLSIPVSNSFIEKVFSVMGNVLTDERNRLCIDSMKSGLCVYFNVPFSCVEFKDAILTNTDLLKATVSKNKYLKS